MEIYIKRPGFQSLSIESEFYYIKRQISDEIIIIY